LCQPVTADDFGAADLGAGVIPVIPFPDQLLSIAEESVSETAGHALQYVVPTAALYSQAP